MTKDFTLVMICLANYSGEEFYTLCFISVSASEEFCSDVKPGAAVLCSCLHWRREEKPFSCWVECSGHLCSPGWAHSECRCRWIYKWDLHPAGEQYQLLCAWGLSAGFVCICLSQGTDTSLGWCLLAVPFKSLLHYFHRWNLWGKCCYFCDRNVTSFRESFF